MNVEKYIDHTLLKATATPKDIEQLCAEANACHFASVCVNPGYVALARKLLNGSDVKVCTVIGFPLGQNTKEVKAYETVDAIATPKTVAPTIIAISLVFNLMFFFGFGSNLSNSFAIKITSLV